MKTELLTLRKQMQSAGIDAYIVPTDDFHSSEYVGSFFRCRAWVSGFTGSAGVLVVTANWAGLWTDGRYFLQASAQLEGSGIELMKMGEEGVPSTTEWLKANLPAGSVLGFDGRVMSCAWGKELEKLDVTLCWERDLVGEIWTDRPPMSKAPVWALQETFTGRSRREKLEQLKADVAEKGCDYHILTSLDDICWLLNLRGDDVACCPVFLSDVVVQGEQVSLYVDAQKLSDQLRTELAADGVAIKPYLSLYDDVKTFHGKVLLEPRKANYAILKGLSADVQLVEAPNPTTLPKARKNSVEVENEALAHIRDGAALTRFMKWVKENVGKQTITEISAAERLEAFRRQQPDYVGPSFEPIMGYAHHGAIIHYSATAESDIALQPAGFLLTDTGGHYLQGSTDVTRTFALGELTPEMKLHYTLVLKGHLNLSAAVFKAGCTGNNLDYLARSPLWEHGLDYNHGTGHGVGYLLNVHEGPQSISYHPGRGTAPLEVGMVTSNEPGLYFAGAYGIRIENLIVCEQRCKNEYGTFLGFRDLTMCPYELDAVDPDLLTENERQLLNRYHAKVYENLAPLFTEEECAWLRHATRPI